MRKSTLDPLLTTSALILLTVASCYAANEDTVFLESYCTKKAFGEYEFDATKKICKATFPIGSEHLTEEQAKEECSKMSPLAVVSAIPGQLQTVCNYRQLGTCSSNVNLGSLKTFMVYSTCLTVKHADKPVTYTEAVQECGKIGASILLSNRHYFRFLTEYLTVNNLDYQSYWFGRSSKSAGSKETAGVVYTGIRSLTLIRPGFTEQVPTSEKHHVVCMKSAERNKEDVWEDAMLTAKVFGGTPFEGSKHIYMLSRGVHQAADKGGLLTFDAFAQACKGIVDGLPSVAAVPVPKNINDIKTLVRDVGPLSVPGRRKQDSKEAPSSNCNGDYRKNGENYFELVQTGQGGKVDVSWKTNYPDNRCADADNTQIVMDAEGLLDAPFFVRNRILCQLGDLYQVGASSPGSHCDGNATFDGSVCKCKRGFRDRGGAWKGQYCEECKDHLVPIFVYFLFDATTASYRYNNGYAKQKEAVYQLATVFGKPNVKVQFQSYGAEQSAGPFSITKEEEFQKVAHDFTNTVNGDPPSTRNEIDKAINDAAANCRKNNDRRCITVLITAPYSFDKDCETELIFGKCNENRFTDEKKWYTVRTHTTGLPGVIAGAAKDLRAAGSETWLVEADGYSEKQHYRQYTNGDSFVFRMNELIYMDDQLISNYCDKSKD